MEYLFLFLICFLAVYFIFKPSAIDELGFVKNSKFNVHKRISTFLEKNKFEEQDTSWVYTNSGSWCYVSVNKKNFYINTRMSFVDSEAKDIEGIFKYSDITWSQVKVQTTVNEKIIKTDLLKKSLIGGLAFGTAGAFAGVLLSGIKQDELITHIILYLKIKNIEETIGIIFWQDGVGVKAKHAAFFIEQSRINKFYAYLIEKDFDSLKTNS